MTTRRNFLTGLAGILASGFAPAAVGSGVLMPVRKVWTPRWVGMDFGSDSWGMVHWVEQRADGTLVFKERVISRDEAMWSPQELAAMPRRPPLVLNMIRPRI
jgi:hypothetical protein